MDFVFFDDGSSPYPAFALPRLGHLHGRQHSSQRLCYRRPGTRFAVWGTFQQATVDFPVLSFFERLPSQDTNAITDSFYGRELGLPLLSPLLLTVGSAGTLLPLHFFGWYPQLPGWYP